MTTRISFWMAVGLWMAVGQAMGQTSPYQPASPPGPYQQTPAADQAAPQPSPAPNATSPYGPSAGRQDGANRQDGASQGFVPQVPTLERRVPQQPPAAPFVLSPQEQQQLDSVLQAWQQNNKNVKTFECKFTRFEYDPVWGNANQPRFVDYGQIKYSAPDKGMYRVEDPRPEHWVCDGQSIFEYNFQKKQLVEYKLPPDLRGKAISDGPLPFLFGADPEKLKQRYYLRVTSQPNPKDIWLEAYPKTQRAAASFHRAELILRDMQPFGLRIHSPNGKSFTSYAFEAIRINEPNLLAPLRFFQNPFQATTPRGWQKIVEPEASQAASNNAPQMSNQPLMPRR